MPPLDEIAVRARLASLPGWELRDGALVKTYTFPAYADAVAFAVRTALLAEASRHHPDILLAYRRVTLTLVTHSEGGVTEKDLDLARRIDAS